MFRHATLSSAGVLCLAAPAPGAPRANCSGVSPDSFGEGHADAPARLAELARAPPHATAAFGLAEAFRMRDLFFPSGWVRRARQLTFAPFS